MDHSATFRNSCGCRTPTRTGCPPPRTVQGVPRGTYTQLAWLREWGELPAQQLRNTPPPIPQAPHEADLGQEPEGRRPSGHSHPNPETAGTETEFWPLDPVSFPRHLPESERLPSAREWPRAEDGGGHRHLPGTRVGSQPARDTTGAQYMSFAANLRRTLRALSTLPLPQGPTVGTCALCLLVHFPIPEYLEAKPGAGGS